MPADKQVTDQHHAGGRQGGHADPVSRRQGESDQRFHRSYADDVSGAPADTYALRFVPRVPVSDYDALTLVVERQSLKLRMLIARDGQSGTSTFVFSNLKENVGLPDSRFQFTIPRGADVITQN